MARAPVFRVDDTILPGVVEVHWAVEVRTTPNNQYSGRGFLTTGVTIRRTVDADDTLAEWASDPDDANRRAGSIEFVGVEGRMQKSLAWTRGWIFDYRVEFNPESGHTEEVVQIQLNEYRLHDDRHLETLIFRPHGDLEPMFETCPNGGR